MKNEEVVDATSMLDILTLNCPKDTMITIGIEDEADRTVLERICELVRSGFGE